LVKPGGPQQLARLPAAQDLGDAPGGLDLIVETDSSLAELTTTLSAFCDGVVDRKEQRPVVLSLQATTREPIWPGEVDVQDISRWERVVRRLERLPAITIAQAHGMCAGPTLDLLIATDYRIGTQDLRVVLPTNDGQFWPGMGTYRLVQRIGLARAMQLVFWSSAVPAALALEIGLISEISGDLRRGRRVAIDLFGSQSKADVAILRQLMEEAGSATFEEALGSHLAACDRELRRLRRSGGPRATD
jgi:isomerase DpgB